MDPSLFKDFLTSRGLKYHYYYTAPVDVDKPVLLLVHGFPSTSYDWYRVVPHLAKAGYGLLVPDMLGYGLTDKPTETKEYVPSKISKDIVDILDFEKIDKAIAVGHDWGSKAVSRLANFYPERFLGFAFLAASYMAPNTAYDYEKTLEIIRGHVGYETIEYWRWFAEDGTDKVIGEHWDSAFSILFPHDPSLWRLDLTPFGTIKGWVTADNKAPLPSYLTEEDKTEQLKHLKRDGIQGPLHWYKLMVNKPCLAAEDDKLIPPSRYTITHPTFYGTALKDQVCVASVGKETMKSFCTRVTIRDFDADHWVIFSHAEEVANALLHWIPAEVLKA